MDTNWTAAEAFRAPARLDNADSRSVWQIQNQLRTMSGMGSEPQFEVGTTESVESAAARFLQQNGNKYTVPFLTTLLKLVIKDPKTGTQQIAAANLLYEVGAGTVDEEWIRLVIKTLNLPDTP